MFRRLILCAVFASGLAGAPRASLASSGAAPAEQSTGQYVDLASVALPIVYEGRLLNYVFATVRINLAKNADVTALREREPYFRDALIRLAHRRPFTRLDDFTALDEAALRAAFAIEAARIAGPGKVTGIQVTNQAPKLRAGLPRPPQVKGAPPRPAAH
jgi:flagellar basal body-associated protein FliL